MARTKRTDRLTISGLSADDQSWLKSEADRLGCDPENLVRMMIRQRSAAVVVPVGFQTGGYGPQVAANSWPFRPVEATVRPPPDLRDTTTSLVTPVQPFDRDAEPDLSELMAEAPQLEEVAEKISRGIEARLAPFDPIAAQRTGRGTQFQRRLPKSNPGGAYGAFSETEVVGVDQSVLGYNGMGDGKMNVLRDNMRHFGVAGTRSR